MKNQNKEILRIQRLFQRHETNALINSYDRLYFKVLNLDDHTQLSFLTLTKPLKTPKNRKTLEK
jgi:hypothetical protein